MDERAAMWDERYAGTEHLWSTEPNVFVADILRSWPAGRALDLGAGEGRNSIWLARRGWGVTAVDFSAVGTARGRAALTAMTDAGEPVDGTVDWVVADATAWEPPAGTAYDLVLLVYLHLPEDVLARASRWLAPGGALVVVGHALRNLTEGVGGPQDPAILNTPEGLEAAAHAGGLTVERCEEVERDTEAGTAIDAVLVARRPG